MPESLFGKRVFFLNPPGVLSDVVSTLRSNEFEIYLVENHTKLARFLKKEPYALVFVNLDDGLAEPEWETWIRAMMGDASTASVGFGVVTMLGDAELSRKYLMDIGLPCGFIILKIGAAKTSEILIKTLEANEARGRRKFVRASCPPGTAEFTASVGGTTLRGNILDLSSVGMAAWIDSSVRLPTGSRLKDLQLTLRGVRMFLDGIVVGRRDTKDDTPVQVLMFDPVSVTDEKREKLRGYIHRVLQDEMNRSLEQG